ncbi:MAG: hypothetical protein HFJ52_01200 [Clostridia bacterium]|nr:hypothetical protein [Clostridia bacterium]
MGDSLITIVAILLTAILMFVFPLMAMSERNDDVSQLTVQTAVSEFTNNAATIGKITTADYEKLVAALYATGNTYDVEIEIRVFDDNPAKKQQALMGNDDKVGENIYYSIYTTQVMEELDEKGTKYMKDGDQLIVKAVNTNNTISQMLKSFFYGLTGNNTYSIVGSESAQVTATGR